MDLLWMFRIIGCLVVLMMLAQASIASNTIRVLDSLDKNPLIDDLRYLEDLTGEMTIDDVVGLNFVSPPSDDSYYGVSDSSFWFKIVLKYESQLQAKKEVLLELGFPAYPVVTLYQLQNGKIKSWLELGLNAGFDQRPIKYRNPVFPITLNADTEQTFYLRIKSRGSATVAPIVLWSPASLLEKIETETIFYGLFYGAMLVMFLYNFFLWISIRDSAYGIYLGYLACAIIWFAIYNGYTFRYLGMGTISEYALPFSSVLVNISLVAFARNFIRISQYSIYLDRSFLVCIAFWLLVLLMIFSAGNHLLKEIIYFINILLAIQALLAFTAVGYCVVKGSREAKFIAVASGFLIVAGMGQALYILKAIPVNFVTFHAVQIAVVMEAVLLSLALANRINTANAKIKSQSDQYRIQLEQDVSARTRELAKAKKAAEKANQAKSTFLAAASHDLRQPLQSISMHIYLMKRVLNGLVSRSQPAKEDCMSAISMADKLDKSTAALTTMLDGILDISKLEAGVIKAEKRYFSIAELIEMRVHEYRLLAQEKNIELRFIDEYAGCQIESDALLFDRIFQNLIMNAIKYTDHGFVSIVLSNPTKRELQIRVQDSGIGIPVNKLDEIFDEFVQVENPERDAAKGLGLGLASVKYLCKLLDISIDVESEVGVGSSFCLHIHDDRVSFIQIDSDSSSKQLCSNKEKEMGGAASEIDLRGISILMVDDDKAVAESLKMVLTNWGGDVSVFHDYDSAIRCSERFDALILDYRLPNEKTGLQVAAEFNAKRAAVPTLILTGDTGSEQLQEIRSSGYRYLSKPVHPDELVCLFTEL